MPIRPENRQALWGVERSDFLFDAHVAAVETLRELAFDALSSPIFWEGYIATTLGGTTTPHKAEQDVEVEYGGDTRRVEVKYSTGYVCAFTRIRGKAWGREVFRWAKPRGCRGKDQVDVIVLIGRSLSARFYAWAIPREVVGERCPSITITCPEARQGDAGKWDRFAVPFDQIAPAVRRIMRGDGPTLVSRREAERRRIADKAGQLAFETACFGPLT